MSGPITREVVLERQKSPDEGAYRATIYVNERARQGPDLALDGLQLENYMRNPVVLWAHDMTGKTASGGLPVGRTNRMRSEGGKLEVDFEFLPDDPFAERVRNAWEQGFLQAASVSWLPLESEESEDGNQRDVQADLLEWSIVSVPSDPDAIRDTHARLIDSMLEEPAAKEDWQYAQKEEEKEEDGVLKRQAGPCWSEYGDCRIKDIVLNAGSEEAPAEEAEEAPPGDGRLLALVRDINSNLRGVQHV